TGPDENGPGDAHKEIRPGPSGQHIVERFPLVDRQPEDRQAARRGSVGLAEEGGDPGLEPLAIGRRPSRRDDERVGIGFGGASAREPACGQDRRRPTGPEPAHCLAAAPRVPSTASTVASPASRFTTIPTLSPGLLALRYSV